MTFRSWCHQNWYKVVNVNKRAEYENLYLMMLLLMLYFYFFAFSKKYERVPKKNPKND